VRFYEVRRSRKPLTFKVPFEIFNRAAATMTLFNSARDIPKGVTHAPALRVHSAVLERLALATIVLIGLSLVIVSRGSGGPYLRPSRKSGPHADTRIQPTTWSPKTSLRSKPELNQF